MLNHSCQRCRSKKLRCDGEQPCSNCAVKGLDYSCTRPLRKERPRRKDVPRQKLHQGLSSRVGHEDTGSPRSSSGNVSDGQIAPIVHSVAATSLGHSRDGHAASPSTSQQSYPSPPVPGSASSYARSKVSSVRRTLTGTSPYEDRAMNDLPSSSPGSHVRHAKSAPEQFTRAPPSMSAYRLTPSQVIEARFLLGSIPAAIRILKYIWAWRCQGTSHSAVHVPTLKRFIRQIYDDEWAQEVTQDQLCLLLMSIAISIQFAPRKGPYAHVWKLVEGLGSTITPEERQGKLHYLARSIFESRLQAPSCTLEGIQTAMLLLLYDLDQDSFKEQLLQWSIKGAKSLRLDHIGRPMNGVPTVEMEMGTRVWWFLVCRDGLSGLSTNTFAIDPSQFTTRVPMLISDDDLACGRLSSKIVAESSTVASSLPLINLAGVVRRLVDIKSRGDVVGQEFSDLVADAFDQYAEELPAIFSLGASAINVPKTGDDTSVYIRQRLETERWLLHQQIFHAYLQLYEIRLDIKVCDQVVGLASHILHLQDKVRDRCAIVDGLRINVTGVMRAITVMTIDLLQKHKNSKVSLVRQLTLGKIHEAIRKCEETSNLAEGDLDSVKKLMEWEEMAWRDKTKSTMPSNSFCLGSILTAPLPAMLDRGSTASLSPASVNDIGNGMTVSPTLSFASSIQRSVDKGAALGGAPSYGSSGNNDGSGLYGSPQQLHNRLYHQESRASMHSNSVPGSSTSGGSPSTPNDQYSADGVSGTAMSSTTPSEDAGEKGRGGHQPPSYFGQPGRKQGQQGHGSGSYATHDGTSGNAPSSSSRVQHAGHGQAQHSLLGAEGSNSGSQQRQQHPSMSVHSMNDDSGHLRSRQYLPSSYQYDQQQQQSQQHFPSNNNNTHNITTTQNQGHAHSHPSHSHSHTSMAPQPHSQPQPQPLPRAQHIVPSNEQQQPPLSAINGVQLNLFPSDTAFSPLFAASSQMSFQPTWEEICATFLAGSGSANASASVSASGNATGAGAGAGLGAGMGAGMSMGMGMGMGPAAGVGAAPIAMSQIL